MIEEIIKPSTTASASASAFEVRESCVALGVSPSGFYAHRHKTKRPRRQQDQVLTAEIEAIFEKSFRSYGSPRLVRALRARGLGTALAPPRRACAA